MLFGLLWFGAGAAAPVVQEWAVISPISVISPQVTARNISPRVTAQNISPRITVSRPELSDD